MPARDGQTPEDEAIGLVDGDVRLDPFEPHARFARWVGGGGIRIWFDRCRILPFEPIDTGVDRRIDLEAIARKGTWVGNVKNPRPKTPEEYPLELEEQMRDLERQFILRNLDRYEMFIDPDEPLPLDKKTVEYANIEAAMAEARDYEHKPPELLDVLILDAVKDEIRWRHRFTTEMRWDRRFGAEVRKHVTGPLWKYDPEAPESAQVARAIEDEISGRTRAPEDEETP